MRNSTEESLEERWGAVRPGGEQGSPVVREGVGNSSRQLPTNSLTKERKVTSGPLDIVVQWLAKWMEVGGCGWVGPSGRRPGRSRKKEKSPETNTV